MRSSLLRGRHRADAHDARRDAGGGTADERAIGVRPWRFAPLPRRASSAQAPSLTPEALPAVTVPPSRNGARSLASCFEGGLRARMLVRVDDHRVALDAAGSSPA